MNEDESTKDMTDDLSDRQLLLDLRQSMGGLVARVGELEKRTNPLPPNFDARFAALERMLAEFKSEMKTELRLLREDIRNEQRARNVLEERVEMLETARAA